MINMAQNYPSKFLQYSTSHLNTFIMSLHLTFIWMVWAGQTTAAVIYRAGTVRTVFVWASITVITST